MFILYYILSTQIYNTRIFYLNSNIFLRVSLQVSLRSPLRQISNSRALRALGAIYDCGGILLISFSFLGHSTAVSFKWKQFPVASLYCNKPTFSGVGYTRIVLESGTNTYTKNTPIAKLIIKTGMFMNFNIIYIVEKHFLTKLHLGILLKRAIFLRDDRRESLLRFPTSLPSVAYPAKSDFRNGMVYFFPFFFFDDLVELCDFPTLSISFANASTSTIAL